MWCRCGPSCFHVPMLVLLLDVAILVTPPVVPSLSSFISAVPESTYISAAYGYAYYVIKSGYVLLMHMVKAAVRYRF